MRADAPRDPGARLRDERTGSHPEPQGPPQVTNLLIEQLRKLEEDDLKENPQLHAPPLQYYKMTPHHNEINTALPWRRSERAWVSSTSSDGAA